MKYVIAKKDIQNDLLAETLSALTNCFRQINAEVYVVGAVARDLAFLLLKAGNTARRTMDLDVAVMLADWSQYERLSEILLNNNFAKAPEKQRFVMYSLFLKQEMGVHDKTYLIILQLSGNDLPSYLHPSGIIIDFIFVSDNALSPICFNVDGNVIFVNTEQ